MLCSGLSGLINIYLKLTGEGVGISEILRREPSILLVTTR